MLGHERFVVFRKRVWMCLCLCVLSFVFDSTAWAVDWPDIDVPPKSSAEWVGRDMKLNGVPLQVRKFDSVLSSAEILSFYRAQWGTQKEKKSVENKRGQWQVIGRIHGPYYLTVQVKNKNKGGSEGFLSASMLPGRVKTELSLDGFPTNGGSKVVSVLDSNDPGKTSRQITLTNGDSVGSNTHYYEAALKNMGWQDKGISQGSNKPQEGSHKIFQKDNQELNLVITRKPENQSTIIVANTLTYLK